MEKQSKNESTIIGTSSGASCSNANLRETKPASPVFLVPARKNDSPFYKFQGCKWDQVFDFEKTLKQIRNAEKHSFRGKIDSAKAGTSATVVRRVQPQVQRLNANDMHFYGIVPKKPSDVVVCDICLGIYTKMGFSNHMRLQHNQAWSSVSSKTSPQKDSHSSAGTHSDSSQETAREINPFVEPMAVAPLSSSSTSNSRHKSSKSGSSGGSSRSRSKSKHHHHHHQQQQQNTSASTSSAAASGSGSHASQTTTSNPELPPPPPPSSKNSKKNSSALSKDESKTSVICKDLQQSLTSTTTVSAPTTTSSKAATTLPSSAKLISPKMTDSTLIPPTNVTSKEKSKASKRKSKYSTATAAPVVHTAPETNESSNATIDYSTATATTSSSISTTTKSSSKRSSKPKSGKDLKQLLDPQLSELDQAVSSITGGKIESMNENTNSNDVEESSNIGSISTPLAGNNLINYSAEVSAALQMPTQQVPMSTIRQEQQLQNQFGSMQMMQETQNVQQNLTGDDNDSSMLTLEDMLDSKFIHEILNTEESEIHFDEQELDKAAAAQQQQQQIQQQQQHGYLQSTAGKRIRYDESLDNNVCVDNNIVGQTNVTGKFAAFQQQQQQPLQQAFHVTNLEDIKMYTSSIDGQQYLTNQQGQHQHQQQQQQLPQAPDQHQITTIDSLQLQQLLYQQQNQDGLNAYAVNTSGMDEVTAAAAAAAALEQQQFNNSDVIMCSAEQLHKEGKINAVDYATLTALSNNNPFGNVTPSSQFHVMNVPSLTDDDDFPGHGANADIVDNKLCNLPTNDVILPQSHYVLPNSGTDEEEQLIYEITANNQVAVISQQRQQQMIAEFLTQAGYDGMENVTSGTGMINQIGPNEGEDIKPQICADEGGNELLDFDYSRLETVTNVSSNSEHRHNTNKTENNSTPGKYISPSSITDDFFLNVFLYAGLPRPLALNSFGLVKLPQSVATTFRKNLHTSRKANNSPVSLSGNGSPAVTTRFGSNSSTSKGNTTEFSSIINQTANNANLSQQQQQQQQQAQFNSQKQGLLTHISGDFVTNSNGLVTPSMNSDSPPAGRSSRLKSAAMNNNSSTSSNSHLKHKQSNHSTSGSNSNSIAFPFPLPQAKTIFVNSNSATTDPSKFIKRSLITKTNPPARNFTNLTAKQLSEILLNPNKDSKEKNLQLLAAREQEKDPTVEEQRLNRVKNFFEHRRRLINATAAAASTATGHNNARQLNIQNSAANSSANVLKQKMLRQRLMRTLSDCGKSSPNSNNNNNSNDVLRVFA